LWVFPKFLVTSWASDTPGEGGGGKRELLGQTEGKKPLERPGRIRKDNTTMEIQVLGWARRTWIELIWLRTEK